MSPHRYSSGKFKFIYLSKFKAAFYLGLSWLCPIKIQRTFTWHILFVVFTHLPLGETTTLHARHLQFLLPSADFILTKVPRCRQQGGRTNTSPFTSTTESPHSYLLGVSSTYHLRRIFISCTIPKSKKKSLGKPTYLSQKL